MKLENRSLAKMLILTFVTCGIYGIIWAVNLARDAVHVKDTNDNGTLEILLTIFFPFVGFYLAEKKFTEGCQMRGIEHKDNSVLYLVLGLVGLGIVDYILMQLDLNKIADMDIVLDAPMGFGYNANYGAPFQQAPQQNYQQAPQQAPYVPYQPTEQPAQQPVDPNFNNNGFNQQ